MTKRVLTMQDISCLGQCSLTVALPIISACGIETVILPSAVLSTHTGGSFKNYTFHDLTDDIPGILKHWKQEGFRFDCLYTGYLGNIRADQSGRGDQKRTAYGMMHRASLILPWQILASCIQALTRRMYIKWRSFAGRQMCFYRIWQRQPFWPGLPYPDQECSEAEVHVLLKGLAALGSKHIILKGVQWYAGSDRCGSLQLRNRQSFLLFYEKITEKRLWNRGLFCLCFYRCLYEGHGDQRGSSTCRRFWFLLPWKQRQEMKNTGMGYTLNRLCHF